MKKLGLIGLSEGNGHPYSWGAIINGFNEQALKNADWDVIYNYVKKRDISEFGFPDVKITHVWTQSNNLSEKLCNSIKAEEVVEHYEDMLTKVDAVLIARDDYDNHLTMAIPFLKAGLKVFIDKPLTLDLHELLIYKPYLESGQLMSVAGLRFAKELDEIRLAVDQGYKFKIIQTTVLNDWEKYGIHLIDGVLGVIAEKPISIQCISNEPEMYLVTFESGIKWTITMAGNAPKIFNMSFIGENLKKEVEIEDNFSMFRRMLFRFSKLVISNEMLYPYENTIISILLLIAGRDSKEKGMKIELKSYYKQLEIEG